MKEFCRTTFDHCTGTQRYSRSTDPDDISGDRVIISYLLNLIIFFLESLMRLLNLLGIKDTEDLYNLDNLKLPGDLGLPGLPGYSSIKLAFY